MRALFILSILLPLAASAPIPFPSIGFWPSLNVLLLSLTQIPCLGAAVQDITKLLTLSLATVATLTGTQTTQNGLSSGTCAAMTVIFARGTCEPGNIGLVVGPIFLSSLKSSMGSASVVMQGVDYPADVPGFLAGGDQAGSQKMAALVTQAMTSCPSTKVVMVGYSQGGQLVHKAASMLPAQTMANVSSVVIFGDPNNGLTVTGMTSSKSMVVCHDGDDICSHGDVILVPHLTYATDAARAAAFVASNAR